MKQVTGCWWYEVHTTWTDSEVGAASLARNLWFPCQCTRPHPYLLGWVLFNDPPKPANLLTLTKESSIECWPGAVWVTWRVKCCHGNNMGHHVRSKGNNETSIFVPKGQLWANEHLHRFLQIMTNTRRMRKSIGSAPPIYNVRYATSSRWFPVSARALVLKSLQLRTSSYFHPASTPIHSSLSQQT